MSDILVSLLTRLGECNSSSVVGFFPRLQGIALAYQIFSSEYLGSSVLPWSFIPNRAALLAPLGGTIPKPLVFYLGELDVCF